MLSAVLVLAGCELPTKPPKLQNRLLLGKETTSLPVSELLPASVQVVGSTFRVTLAPAPLPERRLAEVCGGACAAPPGVQVPKPAFTDSSTVQLGLAGEVMGATLSGGAIEVVLTHGLAFDPLRPAGAVQTGSIRLSARSGGRVIGTLAIDDPFPSGATLRRTVQLVAGEVTGEVVVSAVLHSPAGSPIPSEWLRGDATVLAGAVTPLELAATEARVQVDGKRVAVEQVEVDVSGIDASVIRRVRGGAARITIDNPFAVAGALELRLQRSGVEVRRTLELGADHGTTRVELSEAELHLLLGHKLTMSLDGAVTAGDGGVVVRPGQEIGITTSFELVLEI